MKVMKFGGTSVGKPERMHQVKELITQDAEPKIVVLSALSGTTNQLVKISQQLMAGNKHGAHAIIQELQQHYHSFIEQLYSFPQTKIQASQAIQEHFDLLQVITKISYNEALSKDILAQGELMSTKMFSFLLTELNVEHAYLSALDFMTIDEHEEPELEKIAEKLHAILQANPQPIYVTQGYICKNHKAEIDNLKRGGSDYTASLVAAAIQASVCEIWTDIDGMHNNDPRVVNTTQPVEQLSFEEAAELAYFGAKILHPTCIWPAQLHNVPVKLLNTMQPHAKGTTISSVQPPQGIKAIAAKDDITAIKIKSSRMLLAYGFLRKIFEVFEKYKTSIDMVTTSEVAVTVTIDNTQFLEQIVAELEVYGNIETVQKQTIISMVGYKLASSTLLLQQIFQAIHQIPITMVNYGGSEHNVSLLIPEQYKSQSLQLLNKGLFGL